MTEVTTNGFLTDATSGTSEAASNPNGNSPQPPIVQNYTDGYSYEVPRPFLTLQQAASVLGMTLRSLERSLLGKWGNKLPDGWVARRLRTHGGEDWRILPPPGFRVKLNAPATEYDTDEESDATMADDHERTTPSFAPPDGQVQASPLGVADALNFYTGANATNGGGKRKQQPWRPERHTIDQPTIVIDRTEEVEHLLRELVTTKGALAEERRIHLEDLRMISQLQSSMRLLEVNAAEQVRAKAELEAARQELSAWKQRYTEIINLPWWRRLFKKSV
ncbi:MAG TPA: hypothetical protein V6D22_05670 [Candidatus Obscuribacterales bacterium]